jgi:hypothetical protein
MKAGRGEQASFQGCSLQLTGIKFFRGQTTDVRGPGSRSALRGKRPGSWGAARGEIDFQKLSENFFGAMSLPKNEIHFTKLHIVQPHYTKT